MGCSLEACEKVVGLESPIRDEDASQLLVQDTEPARRGVQELVEVELTDSQFAAITSFVFNVGLNNFSRSTLLRRINEGDFEAAANEFSRWVNVGSKTLPGLVVRRNCESAVFLGKFSDDGTSFDRNLCAPSAD